VQRHLRRSSTRSKSAWCSRISLSALLMLDNGSAARTRLQNGPSTPHLRRLRLLPISFQVLVHSQICCRTPSMAMRCSSLCGIIRANGRSACTQQPAWTKMVNWPAPSLSTISSGDTP